MHRSSIGWRAEPMTTESAIEPKAAPVNLTADQQGMSVWRVPRVRQKHIGFAETMPKATRPDEMIGATERALEPEMNILSPFMDCDLTA
uniref:Uncharacterized protein n=1 Tax=Curvibacter symbiont subsp. Hydra magnipapillata TaxID=667019 RepID=C9Y918_CURXX|nr:hypothetical protein Csp_A06190 [Curvibacter putative symbiont of Hydra magnipapillata]